MMKPKYQETSKDDVFPREYGDWRGGILHVTHATAWPDGRFSCISDVYAERSLTAFHLNQSRGSTDSRMGFGC